MRGRPPPLFFPGADYCTHGGGTSEITITHRSNYPTTVAQGNGQAGVLTPTTTPPTRAPTAPTSAPSSGPTTPAPSAVPTGSPSPALILNVPADCGAVHTDCTEQAPAEAVGTPQARCVGHAAPHDGVCVCIGRLVCDGSLEAGRCLPAHQCVARGETPAPSASPSTPAPTPDPTPAPTTTTPTALPSRRPTRGPTSSAPSQVPTPAPQPPVASGDPAGETLATPRTDAGGDGEAEKVVIGVMAAIVAVLLLVIAAMYQKGKSAQTSQQQQQQQQQQQPNLYAAFGGTNAPKQQSGASTAAPLQARPTHANNTYKSFPTQPPATQPPAEVFSFSDEDLELSL